MILAVSVTAVSAEFSFTFLDPPKDKTTAITKTNTTTSTSSSSGARYGKTVACAAVKTFSAGGGYAQAWANSNAQGINSAAQVCSNAVANAFSDVCNVGNSVAAVTAAADTCATATAKVYVSTLMKAGTSGNAKACVNTCAMSQAVAGAQAQAAAAAIAQAVNFCNQVAIFVNSTAFSRAFVEANANILADACSKDSGNIAIQASAMSSGLASAYANVFSAALAKACTCNPSQCKCPPLPQKATYEDLATSDTYSQVASGRRALTQSVADAAAQYCDGSSIETAVKTVVDAVAKVYTAALVDVSSAIKLNGGAKGCVKAKGNLDMIGVSQAVGEALSQAVATNFANSCKDATAYAHNAAFAADSSALLVNATSQTCGVKGLTQDNSYTVNIPTKNPMAKALTQVFSTVRNVCTCKGACWCATACNAASFCPSFTSQPLYGARRLH